MKLSFLLLALSALEVARAGCNWRVTSSNRKVGQWDIDHSTPKEHNGVHQLLVVRHNGCTFSAMLNDQCAIFDLYKYRCGMLEIEVYPEHQRWLAPHIYGEPLKGFNALETQGEKVIG